MSGPIKVGDLVLIVRWSHKCGQSMLYRIRVVTAICPANPVCRTCGEQICPGESTAILARPGTGVPLSWLRRIPPLSELEGETRREEVPA